MDGQSERTDLRPRPSLQSIRAANGERPRSRSARVEPWASAFRSPIWSRLPPLRVGRRASRRGRSRPTAAGRDRRLSAGLDRRFSRNGGGRVRRSHTHDAKHLLEFRTWVSMKSMTVALRPNSAIAPASTTQLSSSCCPASSSCSRVRSCQQAQRPSVTTSPLATFSFRHRRRTRRDVLGRGDGLPTAAAGHNGPTRASASRT